jgi:hypothetical protein
MEIDDECPNRTSFGTAACATDILVTVALRMGMGMGRSVEALSGRTRHMIEYLETIYREGIPRGMGWRCHAARHGLALPRGVADHVFRCLQPADTVAGDTGITGEAGETGETG